MTIRHFDWEWTFAKDNYESHVTGRIAVAIHGGNLSIDSIGLENHSSPPVGVLVQVWYRILNTMDGSTYQFERESSYRRTRASDDATYAARVLNGVRRNPYAVGIVHDDEGVLFQIIECRNHTTGDYPVRAQIYVNDDGTFTGFEDMWLGDFPPLFDAIMNPETGVVRLYDDQGGELPMMPEDSVWMANGDRIKITEVEFVNWNDGRVEWVQPTRYESLLEELYPDEVYNRQVANARGRRRYLVEFDA